MIEEQTVLERAEATLIRYPRFRELHEDIEECQELSKIADEPQCMSLEGPTGAGKTTLIKDYARQFPRYETGAATLIPVFYLETPSPVTVKGLAQKMLEELGDPAAHKGNQPALNSRLIHLIRECGVELVILDDFQHLIDSETDKILAKVSNWLKVLIKETGVPFLVIGIEGKVEVILEANSQLSRLFAVREELTRFQWELADPDTIQEFADFIRATEEVVDLTLPWQSESDADLLYRLYYATDGVIANIMNLMRGAGRLARKQGAERLELDVLAIVFDKRLAKHLGKTINPFRVSPETPFTPPQCSTPAPEASCGKKKHQDKKKKQPSIAETLSTR
jgi:Cdc6-like AAA superfamily ATPase